MKVKAFAPASIGNVGPGFDILGLAVECAGDIATVSESDTAGVSIEVLNGDPRIPTDPEKNVAAIAAREVMKAAGISRDIHIVLEKGIPLGSGMGGSAASAVVAGVAVNEMLGKPLSKTELLVPITLAEQSVSGGFFCDNTASSLFGGLVLCRSSNPPDIIPLAEFPLHISIVKPDVTILTSEARRILPKTFPHADIIQTTANTCGVVAAFYKQDLALLGRSLEDLLVEPYRSKLIPGFASIKEAAISSGAVGCCISGSGPTMFAVSGDYQTAKNATSAMVDTLNSIGIEAIHYTTQTDSEGAKIIRN